MTVKEKLAYAMFIQNRGFRYTEMIRLLFEIQFEGRVIYNSKRDRGYYATNFSNTRWKSGYMWTITTCAIRKNEGGDNLWYPHIDKKRWEKKFTNEINPLDFQTKTTEVISTQEKYPNSEKPLYQRICEEMKFKVGDRVKVLRKAGSKELGWDNSWASPQMDTAIGLEGVISSDPASDMGLYIEFKNNPVTTIGQSLDFYRHYLYPVFVLELLEEAPKFVTVSEITEDYDAKVFKDRIEVGCQTIKAYKFQEIVKAWESLQ